MGPWTCSLPGECCAGRVSILSGPGTPRTPAGSPEACLSPATPAHAHSEGDFLLLARLGWEPRDVNQAGQDRWRGRAPSRVQLLPFRGDL